MWPSHRDSHMCHRNLGKSPLWGIFLLWEIFRDEVPVIFFCIPPQTTRKQRETPLHLLLFPCLRICRCRKCKCVWAHSVSSSGRGGSDPKRTWWLYKASLPLLAPGKAETQMYTQTPPRQAPSPHPVPSSRKSSATHMRQPQPPFTSPRSVHQRLLFLLLQAKRAFTSRDAFPLGCFVWDSPDEHRLVYVIIWVGLLP